MLIGIHMIRNYGVSCVNRGEDGEPKTVVYGGRKRIRVSSQSRKRKWRMSETFRKALEDGLVSVRTRSIGVMIKEELMADGCDEDVAMKIGAELTQFVNTDNDDKKAENSAKKQTNSDKDKPAVSEDDLIAKSVRAFAQSDIDMIRNFIAEELTNDDVMMNIETFKKGKCKPNFNIIDFTKLKLDWPVTVDLAMFGRMPVVARAKGTIPAVSKVYGAVYVNHAISTHAANDDLDFFLAMDDLIDEGDSTGAAHIGNNSFDSACMYESSYIDVDILSANLKDLDNNYEVMKSAVRALIATMALEVPGGRQNTMLSMPTPSAILIEVHDNNVFFDYANAFQEAITGPRIVRDSVMALKSACEDYDVKFGAFRKLNRRLWLSDFDSDDGFAFPDADPEKNIPTTMIMSSLAEMIDKAVEVL